MEQLTKEQAIAFAESKAWERMGHRARAKFQMAQDLLCMPFGVFHESVEKALGRPVFTHEFGLNRDGLLAELNDGAEPPSLREIIEMIPEEKRVVILCGTQPQNG